MTRISDVVSVQDLRDLHGIFSDLSQGYLRSGAFGVARTRDVEQRIRNVPGRRLRRILDAVEDVSFDKLRPAWSAFMAYGAGTHVWPDANHRTTMAAFSLFSERAFGCMIGLPGERAAQLVVASKAMRDGARRQRPGRARYYTVEELADPEHPYRKLFAGYEEHLIIKAAQQV